MRLKNRIAWQLVNYREENNKAISMVVLKNTDLFCWFASCRSKTI
jgi:hypothetical protein